MMRAENHRLLDYSTLHPSVPSEQLGSMIAGM